MKRKIFLQSIVFAYAFVGCATVHQVPMVDREKMSNYESPNESKYDRDESGHYFFGVSIDDAVKSVTNTGYELEIPFYYPAFNSEHSMVRMVSGPFVARCKEDCDCGKKGASGHGAEAATGILLIELETRKQGQLQGTAVKVATMFYRTQTTDGGEYGSTTKNLYFHTLGHVEEAILEGLLNLAKQ